MASVTKQQNRIKCHHFSQSHSLCHLEPRRVGVEVRLLCSSTQTPSHTHTFMRMLLFVYVQMGFLLHSSFCLISISFICSFVPSKDHVHIHAHICTHACMPPYSHSLAAAFSQVCGSSFYSAFVRECFLFFDTNHLFLTHTGIYSSVVQNEWGENDAERWCNNNGNKRMATFYNHVTLMHTYITQ